MSGEATEPDGDEIGYTIVAPALVLPASSDFSILVARGLFRLAHARRAHSRFGTPEHHCVSSDSVASSLTSAFSAAGG
jgi:hypothetical protein